LAESPSQGNFLSFNPKKILGDPIKNTKLLKGASGQGFNSTLEISFN
jgi:hypothetical protein